MYPEIVVNDRPDGAWSLDSAPFVDLSGNNQLATGTRVYNYSANQTLGTTTSMFGLGSAAATRVVETGVGIYAGSAIRVTATGSGGLGVAFGVPVTASTSARTFTAGIWVQTDSAKAISTYAEWNGGGAGGANGVASSTSNTGWQFIRGTFTLPANATNFRVGALMTATAGNSYLVSGHIVVLGSTLNPAELDLARMYETHRQAAPHGQAYVLSRNLVQEIPLVSTTGPAVRVTPDNRLEVNSSVMTRGKEKDPFSLEVWFKPLVVPSTVSLLGHLNTDDGLTYNGDSIRFTTNYASTGSCTVIYNPHDTEKAHHVVGVSTAVSNQLWVDGLLVGETTLSIAQQADQYANFDEPGVLVSGYSTSGTAQVIVDFPAVYPQALTEQQILRHYSAGVSTDDFISVVGYYNGDHWLLDDSRTNIIRKQTFNSPDTWALGLHTDISSISGSLTPNYTVDGGTVSGNWKYGFSLDPNRFPTATKIEWDGDGGFVVEYSVDEINWIACTNGQGLTGLNDSAISLAIRVRFTTNESGTDPAVVRFLRLTLYGDITMPSHRGTRSLQWFNEASPGARPFRPIEQSNTGRMDVYGGHGLITASSLPDAFTAVGTLELWVKPSVLDANSRTLADFSWDASEGAKVWWTGTEWSYRNCLVYTNSEPQHTSGFAMDTSRWTHVMIVPNTPSNDAVQLMRGLRENRTLRALLGFAAVYPSKLDPTQVADIYSSYLSRETMRITDETSLFVRQRDENVRVYAFDWSPASST